jgi:bifunctional ADP-heptose synthase (sugar kinase/adenylyltransferase)
MTASTGVNIFVFGDLVLDHLIPVKDKTRQSQPAGKETVVDGRPRKTFTGGAANCARLIAAQGSGRTCLWGLSGHSSWGSFPQLLQRSQAIDQADEAIIYHGAHDESHQMNTITRIVYEDPSGKTERHYRIDDVPQIPVTESQVRDALGYLAAEADEHEVSAIILNDLDMKALNAPLVNGIGQLAASRTIPVFVDPKRDWSIFRNISILCALPNLREWCYLVDQSAHESKWRRGLDSPDSLQRMALRSLSYMPGARFHLIKCDIDGAVLIGPGKPGQRAACHIPAHRTNPGRYTQLGPGDVLVAALALEIAHRKTDTSTIESFLPAVQKASAVVACYLELDWHVMPNRREMAAFTRADPAIQARTAVPEGVLLLPVTESRTINLVDHSIRNSGLVSVDPAYKGVVENLLEFFSSGWDSNSPPSAILTGRGGVGKSDVCSILQTHLSSVRVRVWTDFACHQDACPTVAAAVEAIRDTWDRGASGSQGLVVVIDEAFSKAPHLLLGELGKMLLQLSFAPVHPARFLFIDADYHRHVQGISASQFLTRCRLFELPPLSARLKDVPFIFAAGCMKHLEKRLGKPQQRPLRISEAVLTGISNWVLLTPQDKQSAREVISIAKIVVDATLSDAGKVSRPPQISKRHLPSTVAETLGPTERVKTFYEFLWQPWPIVAVP